MSRAATHVVEYALREHFGAPEPGDVTWRVLRELREPPDARRTSGPHPRLHWLWPAAAVAVALVAALWPWRSEPPRASTSRPLDVFEATGASSRTTAVPPDRVALAPVSTRVELPDGTRIEATPGTRFRWSRGSHALEVFAGELELLTGGGELVVATSTGSLELAARSRARLEVAPERESVPRNQLARSIAMDLRPVPIAVTLTATLLAGTGTLHCGGPPHELAAGRPVIVDADYGSSALSTARGEENPFEHEPGVWDLYEPPGATAPTATETVRVGPHPHSLIVDTATLDPDRPRAAHVVLKYEADRGRITGSMLDNFGGPIGIIRGELDEEGGRVLELYRIDGTPFDLRLRASRVAGAERRTIFEAKQDGEWQAMREVLHRRRPAEVVPDEDDR